MNERKKYQVLESLPTYGPMYIPVSKSGEPFYSEGFPIRFHKSDGTDWVANFEPGWTELSEIFELSKTEHLLIIARGTCYIMDVDYTNPISAFGMGYSALLASPDGRVVLQDQTDITIIETDGEYWHTERISWDGLKDLKLENDIVTGLSYDPTNSLEEWSKFTLNINTKILTGGSYMVHK